MDHPKATMLAAVTAGEFERRDKRIQQLEAINNELVEALREIAVVTLPTNPNGRPSPLTDGQRVQISEIVHTALTKARGE